MTVPKLAGCVYVVATPIGNLEDLTPRARRLLEEVAVIACEDTRHTARLCTHYGIRTRRVSLHAHNERSRIAPLLARLEAGESIALVSDAGTPLLSDPGERLVAAAIEAGFDVVPVPGPSALLAALVASGLPTRSFAFFGFPPRKPAARSALFATLAQFPGTLVFFEAPTRAARTLEDLHAALGARRVALARELSKRHECILRGTLGELRLEELRGELTIVVEGAGEPADLEPVEADVDARIDALLAQGQSARDVSRSVAVELGLSRSDAYRRVLARSGGG